MSSLTPGTYQTHATELDGTAGRGLFAFAEKVILTSLWGNCDDGTDMEWKIYLDFEDDTGVERQWKLKQDLTSDHITFTGVIEVPANAKIRVVTNSVAANPRCNIIYRK